MKKIIAEAPTRIDLAGGTLDIPPLYLFHEPAITVNAAIEIKARATISRSRIMRVISYDQNTEAVWNRAEDISWKNYLKLELILRIISSFKPQENFQVEIESQAPVGSGLGGSSVIAIALTAALAKWSNKNFSNEELIDYAKSIETQTIRVPTGYQDYWGAVYGGIHAYEMGINGNLKLTSLGLDSFRRELEKHALLVYTGKPHFSGINNWELFKRHIDGDQKIIVFFDRLKENALSMKEAVESGIIARVADVLNKDWRIRKEMIPGMTTLEIEKLTKKAFGLGAFSIRVCGAGGGGCALLLVKPEKRKELTASIEKMNMRVLPVKISKTGVKIHEV